MNSNEKIKIGIASTLVLSIGIGFFATNYKLNKKSPYNAPSTSYSDGTDFYNESTSIVEENEETTTVDISRLESTTTEVSEDKKEQDNEENINEDTKNKENLRKELQDVLKNKKFDLETKELLNQIFNDIYDNYDSYYDVYKTKIKDKATYIREEFILVIKNNVDQIVIFDKYDPSNKKLAEQLGNDASGRFIIDEKKILINNEIDDVDKKTVLLHELGHANQFGLFRSKTLNGGMYDLLVEGETTGKMAKSNSTITTDQGSYCIFDGDIRYNFSAPQTNQNAVYSRYYNILFELTDDKFMDDLKEHYSEIKIINKIKENYDIDATKLLRLMKKCTNPEINDIKEVEKLYLECIKQDIEKTSSKEELISIFNKYRLHKLQYGISCYVIDADFNAIDVTDEEFVYYSEIEKILLKKCVQYDIFNTANDIETFNIILYNKSEMSINDAEISINNLSFFETDSQLIIVGKTSDTVQIYENGAVITTSKENFKKQDIPLITDSSTTKRL